MITTDVAVIGTGTAGLSAYRAAKLHTDKVLLIEGLNYGTTCARVGCMPSKLFIAAAENVKALHRSHSFGINHQGYEVDGKAFLKRVKDERDRFVGFVNATVANIPEQDKLWGMASFVDNHTLRVGTNHTVKAKRIIIATGSTPFIPNNLKPLGERVVINDSLFEWDELPRSVAVFGAGVIGLELGQALNTLGVRVTIFGTRGGLASLSDPEIRDYAINTFSDELELDVNAKINGLEKTDHGVNINYFHSKEQQDVSINVDYVLAAAGRRPNLEPLSLGRTNVNCDERGLPIVDPYTLQTSEPHIFMAGDASNLLPLLHEAANQGRIAGTNASLYPQVKAEEQKPFIGIVFTSPNITIVGETYQALLKRYGNDKAFAVGEVSFEDQGRARVILKNKGLVHLYAEYGSGLLLGAEMISPAAEHFAHLINWAICQRLSVCDLLEMPFYHPVLEEGLRTALRDLQSKLKRARPPENNCLECGPGT